MFEKSARFYDAIYGSKDYAGEAARLHAMIGAHKRSPGRDLLDVACGTGAHLLHLRHHYHCQGLDLDENLLAVARERLPDLPLHRGDMVDFDLGRSFDVVTCLFSAIGYVKTGERLQAAVATMARHLRSGGVLLVEPWLTPERWQVGGLHALHVDEPDLKITRMNISEREGDCSVILFHYLIGTPEGIVYERERHELGLFTLDEYGAAFARAGLVTHFDEQGLIGRGLFIGRKPLPL